ncbi:MAG: Ultraviolet N-glycosylase/AP lyase [Syntrophorhabdus sp. PtaU1.Bin153]|nr:MAG: Ultraviolet N-glycosylase/AP lyase [Syntrophorhabdus sp. PtaU1.Bin153]
MQKDIKEIISNLRKMHGAPRCELIFSNPVELVVATVLSAQATDQKVNEVTRSLFQKYRVWKDYLSVPIEELEEDIRPTGFYRNKAKSIRNIAGEIEGRFGGRIPEDVDTFATVKGIGRKSANLIVGLAFGKPAIVVDTHVIRVSRRIGLTVNKDPDKIEQDLRKIIPEGMWTDFSLLVTLHGRYMCKAKNPECETCLIRESCDYYKGGRKDV